MFERRVDYEWSCTISVQPTVHSTQKSASLFISPESTNTHAFCTVDITRLTDVTHVLSVGSPDNFAELLIDQTIMLSHYHKIDPYL
jgi:hypothetical protein